MRSTSGARTHSCARRSGGGPGTWRCFLVEAAPLHLDERDDATAARPFVEFLARRSPGDPRIEPLRRGLDESAPATEVGSDEVRDAIESARRSGDACAIDALAEKLMAEDRLPEETDLLAVLERHVLAPATRASLARAAARALGKAGRPGAAALALTRAGTVVRDAATLGAAIDLAEGAEAWPEAVRGGVARDRGGRRGAGVRGAGGAAGAERGAGACNA